MTRAEIRRHALAIAEMRRSSRSKAAQRREDRGYDAPGDFVQGRVYGVNVRNVGGGYGAVDQMFAVHERSGRLPKGSWS